MNSEKTLQILMGVVCGLVCCGLDFYVVPNYFARGVPDPVWIGLMLLLPAAAAMVLLHRVCPCPPRCVFYGLAAQWAILILFGRTIGAELGYRLGDLTWDLFDWIAYLMFVLSISAGGALAQFLVLHVLRRTH